MQAKTYEHNVMSTGGEPERRREGPLRKERVHAPDLPMKQMPERRQDLGAGSGPTPSKELSIRGSIKFVAWHPVLYVHLGPIRTPFIPAATRFQRQCEVLAQVNVHQSAHVNLEPRSGSKGAVKRDPSLPSPPNEAHARRRCRRPRRHTLLALVR